MPPIRVLHVTWRTGHFGGVQVAQAHLIAASDPSVVQHEVVTVRPIVEGDELEEGPVHVRSLDLGFDRRLTPASRLQVAARVARLVRAEHPDVVHLLGGTAWTGTLVPLAAPRCPVVVQVHDEPGSGRHGRATERFEPALVALARATVVVHSRSVERAVVERWRRPPGTVRRFPLAVDVDAFGPTGPSAAEAWRHAHGLAPDTFVVITVGRAVPSKRLDVAVDALARLAALGVDAHLVVVGAGDALGPLGEQGRQLAVADRLHLLGEVPSGELRTALHAADVYASTSDYEGFGLTIAEAMAAGLPVVATAVGGVPDVVQDGRTGTLVPPGDPEAVAHALLALAADPARRRALGQAGRARAGAVFAPGSLARSFAELYEEVARR